MVSCPNSSVGCELACPTAPESSRARTQGEHHGDQPVPTSADETDVTAYDGCLCPGCLAEEAGNRVYVDPMSGYTVFTALALSEARRVLHCPYPAEEQRRAGRPAS